MKKILIACLFGLNSMALAQQQDDLCQDAKTRGFAKGINGWYFQPYDFTTQFPISSETSLGLRQLASILKSQDVKIIAAVLPTRASLYYKNLSSKDIPKEFKPDQAIKNYKAFLTLLNQSGISAPDLYEVGRKMNGREFYLRRDHHWTHEGAEATARAINQSIKNVSLEPLGKLDFTKKSAGSKEMLGSISPQISQLCKSPPLDPEREEVFWIERHNVGLLEDSVQDVTIVGTSNSRDESSFQTLLIETLKTDVNRYYVDGGGPIIALQNYLMSNEFKNHKPKFIIWEFPIVETQITHGNIGISFNDPTIFSQINASISHICDKNNSFSNRSGQLSSNFTVFSNTSNITNKPLLLNIKFSDLSIDEFSIVTIYTDKSSSMSVIKRSPASVQNGEGKFYFSIPRSSKIIQNISIRTTKPAGSLEAKVCSS